MSKELIFFLQLFYYQFYFNTIHVKCYTKSDRPTKTTIYYSPQFDAWSSPAQPHFHIHQLPDCKICSLINYHCVKKNEAQLPSGAQGRKLNKSKLNNTHVECSCGSVVEHCVSSTKGCGFNSQASNLLIKKFIACMHCKSLWIKASANCINVMNDYAFRDLYISSEAESLNAAIAKKKKHSLDILRTISED